MIGTYLNLPTSSTIISDIEDYVSNFWDNEIIYLYGGIIIGGLALLFIGKQIYRAFKKIL